MAIKRIFFFLLLFSLAPSIALCQEAGRGNLASDYIKEGNVCYNNKAYAKALSLYTKAANEDPKNILAAVAHYKCAKTLEVMGKHDNAIAECSKSIAINPLMAKGIAYHLRAFIYEKTGKYIEAISDYSKAIIVNPEDKEAGARRQRLLTEIYTKFVNEGLDAFNRGLAAYNKKDASASKYLGKASSLFAHAMSFDIGDEAAFAMANFTKGLTFQIISRDILGKIKGAPSDKEAAPQLASAYYALAVTNAYYNKTFSLLKNEKLKNSLNELKAENDKEMNMIRPRFAGLKAGSDEYVKAADLEAACIVNFDAASQSISAGNHDGASRILRENDSMVSDLRRLKSANAEGIRYLTNAYAGLNTIFSYPLADRSWLKKNLTTLDKKIDDCLKDLDHAESALLNKELVNNCSRLSKDVSALKDMVKKIGKMQ